MEMDISTLSISELNQRLKNVKKLMKYTEGLSSAPEEHQERISRNIRNLQDKLGLDVDSDLLDVRNNIERIIEQMNGFEEGLSYPAGIGGWYLRPLINHFDSVDKVKTFSDHTEGAAGLEQNLQLFIPEVEKKELHQLFQFKACGKGSEESRKLEAKFYEQFEITSVNPFSKYSPDIIEVPLISYNTAVFWERLAAGESAALVTGLCPLSTITDELGFVLDGGDVVRPTMGFEPLPVEHKNIDGISWPKRPIISDYVTLRYIFELYSKLQSYSNLSMLIWYPEHEYFLDLTESIFKQHIDAGIIHGRQIKNGLDELKARYLRLIDFVKSEHDLLSPKQQERLEIVEVTKDIHQELDGLKKHLDLSFFKVIYGSWHGSELRRELYEQLIIKHIRPVFEGINTLHMDCSYESWVDILGSLTMEKHTTGEKTYGNYSWISYPSLPSISMSMMREFNAPNNDKLYLAGDKKSFQKRLAGLSRSYILKVAPMVLKSHEIINKAPDEVIEMFNRKLFELNSVLNND
jgi:hypothetical protein